MITIDKDKLRSIPLNSGRVPISGKQMCIKAAFLASVVDRFGRTSDWDVNGKYFLSFGNLYHLFYWNFRTRSGVMYEQYPQLARVLDRYEDRLIVGRTGITEDLISELEEHNLVNWKTNSRQTETALVAA